MPRKDTAGSVKKHTEAKLQFYTRYLERYLQILVSTQAVDKINIYDLYCGAGQYSDGNTGSALRAVDAVWVAQEKNRECKIINLHLNDLNTNKVRKLRELLSDRDSKEKRFSISYSTKEAFKFLEELVPKLALQGRKTRNLLFVDPYGYKDIDRKVLESIMESGKTEIVMFLPIEQMYRFKSKAVDENVDSSYLPLRNFIDQFELDVDSIESEKDFIKSLESAFSFGGKYFTASYSIRNHTGHHYGMFFVTANVYGLEKIIEVKWELDPQIGEGFTGDNQVDFFLEADRLADLQDSIMGQIKKRETDNRLMYLFVLNKGFKPAHATEIAKKLCAEKEIHKLDVNTMKPARKNAFKINYREYKSGVPSIIYRVGSGE